TMRLKSPCIMRLARYPYQKLPMNFSDEAKIKTSVKVKHWNPDVVVSSYTTTGKSTWKNTRSYSTGSTSKLGAGDDTNSQRSSKRQHSATTFREVDAVGNPALAAMWLLSVPAICVHL
ncbi:MAG: TraU family protein, partial [gamma proteobacterium symbiont of Lucinoma myriamae]|nr:TraU family protein [gamma proteobacterium symbiont of Lucinoma myriamae]